MFVKQQHHLLVGQEHLEPERILIAHVKTIHGRLPETRSIRFGRTPPLGEGDLLPLAPDPYINKETVSLSISMSDGISMSCEISM